MEKASHAAIIATVLPANGTKIQRNGYATDTMQQQNSNRRAGMVLQCRKGTHRRPRIQSIRNKRDYCEEMETMTEDSLIKQIEDAEQKLKCRLDSCNKQKHGFSCDLYAGHPGNHIAEYKGRFMVWK